MAWKPQYAAFRYFRRRGDTVEKSVKLVVYNSPASESATHTKHTGTLRKLKYDFANSLFSRVKL